VVLLHIIGQWSDHAHQRNDEGKEVMPESDQKHSDEIGKGKNCCRMKLKLPTFATNSRPMQGQTINIYNTVTAPGADYSVIINQLNTIMATLAELTDKLNELQAALDNEQAQVQSAIDGLTAQIAALNEQIANGASPEQLTEVVAKIEAIKADLEGTIPDLPTPTDEGTPA